MFETGAEEVAYDRGFSAAKPYWVAIDRQELIERLLDDAVIRTTFEVDQVNYLVDLIDNLPNEDVA